MDTRVRTTMWSSTRTETIAATIRKLMSMKFDAEVWGRSGKVHAWVGFSKYHGVIFTKNGPLLLQGPPPRNFGSRIGVELCMDPRIMSYRIKLS